MQAGSFFRVHRQENLADIFTEPGLFFPVDINIHYCMCLMLTMIISILSTCRQCEGMGQNKDRERGGGWVGWRVNESDDAKYPNQIDQF